MKRIFLLEDDEALGRGIAMALESQECSVTLAQTLKQAESVLREPFSLLILDINLPDGSGLELLRSLRRGGFQTPAILLTANDLELDEVAGLEAGADDYITKPFGFVFDFSRMTFSRNGSAVDLSRTEQRLLRLLVENRGRTLPRSLLLDRVWDRGEFVDENALSVAVRRLRAKLGDAPIKTVYGVGYSWEAGR